MLRNRFTLPFSISLVVIFVATFILQPRPLAQTGNEKDALTSSQITGNGLTTDPTARRREDFVSVPQDGAGSISSSEIESGTAPPDVGEEEVGPTAIINPPTLPGGVDYAAAGTGTRNAGYGTIRMRGVPPNSTVVRAWLYWGTVYANPAPNTATAVFNGTTVSGSRVGLTGEPCWLFQNASFALYRANVKTLVLAAINGDYKITGLASAITNGRDPFVCAPPFASPPTPGSEGAGLIVIYSHNSIPTSARTYLHHVTSLVTGTTTFTHSLSPAIPNHNVLKQTRIGADGQVGCSLYSIGIANGETTAIGANIGSLTLIKGPTSTISTDADWNGDDGDSLNQLWDTHTNAFGSVNGINPISAGVFQYVVKYSSVGDCFVPAVHILSAK